MGVILILIYAPGPSYEQLSTDLLCTSPVYMFKNTGNDRIITKILRNAFFSSSSWGITVDNSVEKVENFRYSGEKSLLVKE
ncbi:MAG TPA: hypothetical protein DCS74_02170 [Veillonellaceae bacterium]|nr:hypothetical protein [Veillonellaceae bacterium]